MGDANQDLRTPPWITRRDGSVSIVPSIQDLNTDPDTARKVALIIFIKNIGLWNGSTKITLVAKINLTTKVQS